MQDIVFYAAANETLGLVRDYTNMHRADAPVLTIGVAACLRLRLFADIEVSTPYPVASFGDITDWRWSMDADFDRSTACKLVADEDGISVHTVTDTVNGETRSFTEFVIPISNMNTQELAAWLGNDGTKTGLTGELVGYDNNGNAVFVLQVENFSVRNRVAGLCDPTAVDEGIVTRSIAEQMIQTAVSSSAATKQDKLTASNGGTGITVTNTGIISVSDVPQLAVTGLVSDLAGKQDKLTSSNGGTGITVTNAGIISVSDVPQLAVTGLVSDLAGKQDKLTSSNGGTGITVTNSGIISVSDVPQLAVTGLVSDLAGKQGCITAGYRLEMDDDTLSVKRYMYITTAGAAATSVTLKAGEAYKVNATAHAITLNTETIPANSFGLEGHLEIFVAGTGYVVTGSNVVLANALEPDAVNNCTVRFHDGYAIISVEDHVAGYIVTVNAASGAGSLAYGLSTATNEYISVDASLNGQTLDLAGSTTYAGEKHVVGNGYEETIVSGGITCTSKTTFSNLSMQDVVVNGGTMTLGDVNIPNGSTVTAGTNGSVTVESVTIDGVLSCSSISAPGTPRIMGNGTLALPNGLSFLYYGAATANYHFDASGITITSGKIEANRKLNLSNCVFNGATYPSTSAGILVQAGAIVNLSGCTFTPFAFTNAVVLNGGSVNIENCDFGSDCNVRVQAATEAVPVNLSGTVKTKAQFADAARTAVLNIALGAVLDLTGNTNSVVTAPGGGIVIADGDATASCTVINSAGTSVSIAGGTYTQINNDGTTE